MQFGNIKRLLYIVLATITLTGCGQKINPQNLTNISQEPNIKPNSSGITLTELSSSPEKIEGIPEDHSGNTTNLSSKSEQVGYIYDSEYLYNDNEVPCELTITDKDSGNIEQLTLEPNEYLYTGDDNIIEYYPIDDGENRDADNNEDIADSSVAEINRSDEAANADNMTEDSEYSYEIFNHEKPGTQNKSVDDNEDTVIIYCDSIYAPSAVELDGKDRIWIPLDNGEYMYGADPAYDFYLMSDEGNRTILHVDSDELYDDNGNRYVITGEAKFIDYHGTWTDNGKYVISAYYDGKLK